VFSAKLKCGDCGEYFGSKVWHSNSKYKRTVWQCNAKFKGESRCATPHLYEQRIKELFLEALGILMENREEIIGDCRAVMETLADCGSIDTEMENACANGVSRTSFLADSGLTTEIDIDTLILNGLLSELQASDPESYEILMAIADGLSERAGAERLHMPRNTFVYKRNQLLKRLKEKF